MSTKRINVTTILPPSALFIGYVAENGVTNVEFDVSAWVTMYGSGTATLIMKRWGDANPYPIALEVDNEGLATWTISATDTAKTGFAYAQLRYEAGTKVKKSPIYTLKIGESLGSPAEAPDQYEDWIDALTHLAAEAMAEVLDIEGIVTDKTLTVDGGVADAKATGDALSALEDQFAEETDKLKADLDAYDDAIREEIGNIGWNRITFTSDSFIDLSGSTADVTHMSSPAYGFSCAVVQCSAGDKFLLNLTGGGRSRAWGFVAANGNIISVADADTTVSNYTLIAPTNAAYLVLHDNSGSKSYIKGETLVEMIEARAGLSVEVKEALIACFDNAAWKGTDGSSYVDALRSALGLVVWDYNWNATSKLNPPDMTAYSFDFNDEAGAVKVNQPNLTLTHSGEFDFEIVCRFVVLPGSGQPFFAIAYATKNGSDSLQIRPNASLDDDNLKDKISYTLNWDANTKQFTPYTQTVYRKYRVVVESGSLKFYIDNNLIIQKSYDKSEPTGTNTVRIVSAEHPYNIYNMHIKSIKFRDIVSN